MDLMCPSIQEGLFTHELADVVDSFQLYCVLCV